MGAGSSSPRNKAAGRGREGSHWRHLVLMFRFGEAVPPHSHASTLPFTCLRSSSQFCVHSYTHLTHSHTNTVPYLLAVSSKAAQVPKTLCSSWQVFYSLQQPVGPSTSLSEFRDTYPYPICCDVSKGSC